VTAAALPAAAHVSARRSLGIFAVALAALGLSSGSSLVKLAGAPGSVVAFWRLAFGAAIWGAIILVTRTPMPLAVVRRVAPAGVLFGLNILLFFSAVKATRVANAEFIGTLTPVVTVPLAALVLREHVRWRPLVLGIPALFGVALIVFNAPARGEQSWKGDVLAVGAICTWSCFLLFTKWLRSTTKVTTTQFMGTLSPIAAVVVLPFAAVTGDLVDLTPEGWAICVLLAFITGTAGHGLLVWAQRHVELSTISVMQVAQPALAATWAYLLLDESVEPVQLVGMAIVLGSLTIFTIANSRR
jgi:drug/metabolite transporter (DMT)-like permease